MVVDRERLEDLAGDSYGRPKAEYSRIIAPFGKSKAEQLRPLLLRGAL